MILDTEGDNDEVSQLQDYIDESEDEEFLTELHAALLRAGFDEVFTDLVGNDI